jgi:hypothetical protein
MRTRAVETIAGVAVTLLDSVSEIKPDDAGTIVVTGSHGGRSSGAIAVRVTARAAFFNDAGVGKDGAGLVALAMLDDKGVIGGTVGHDTARIGDARDSWMSGILTHVNETAQSAGLVAGVSLRDGVHALLTREILGIEATEAGFAPLRCLRGVSQLT